MKKISLILSMLLLVFTFAVLGGCSNTAPNSDSKENSKTEENNETTTSKKKLVGYCMPDTSEAFLASLSNSVKELFAADGVEVQIANAAGDASTQVSQIENFTMMKADLIIVMAVDPTSVGDAIKKAQAAGCKVLVAGSDPGAYDAIMYIDQFEDGKMIAELATEWINEKFKDAEAGSIPVAIFEDRSTPEASQRCDGIAEISKMCPAVNVVKVVGSIKGTADAQAAAENLFQTNPEVKVILCYNSAGAIGVNAYAMQAGSKVTDKENFAIFASDIDPQSLEAVSNSTENNSVLRGLVKFGGDDLAADTYGLAKKMVDGEAFEKMNPDPLTKITPENVANFLE